MTLLEIMISSGLILLVFLGVYLILDRGLRFFRLNSDANERQREALAFLTRLNVTMQNTRSDLIYVEAASGSSPTGVAPAPTVYPSALGIACAVAQDPNGRFLFEPPDYKKLLWHAHAVFFLTADGQLRFIRKELTPATSTPQSPLLAGQTPGVYTATPQAGIVLAKQVSKLSFTHHHAGELLPGSPPRTLAKDYFDVVIECGKRGDPLGYWIQLRSAFFPRN
jgi:hypothetical protein